MKKFVSILLILVLMFALASVVFADTDVSSPEKENTDVQPDDKPVAPQTGETSAIYWVIAAMILAVGTVAFCGKKLVEEK